MKKLILGTFMLMGAIGYSQDNGYFFGGLESNSQWLLDDEDFNFIAPEDQFRANNYLQMNYTLGKFTAGVQYESYLPSALLGYSDTWNGQNGIGTYYLNFRNETLDITGGYFYEQFGSGLILRTWENRQLGINNALKGVRVKFSPSATFDLTGVYGQTRNGFDVSEGVIQGLDANLNLSDLMKIDAVDLKLGASYVGRYQDNGANDTIPANINAYGGRLDFVVSNFYGGIEAIAKDPDVLINEEVVTSPQLFDGTALQLNLGYAQKGLGINSTFRRLENFTFYSDRYAEGNQFNEQLVNYVPAITKQHDYLLSNIYVYNAQPRLLFSENEKRAGEVGTQLDVYFSFDKESALGKVGTKLAGNFSYWAGLETTFNAGDLTYDAKFIGDGDRYFRDLNIEIKNRWTSKWSTVVSYQDVIIDKAVSKGGILGSEGDIRAQIAVIEGTRRFEKGKALRMELQHLWTPDDDKNWAAGVLEYNFNSTITIYAADSWNYGGEKEFHYYSVGGSYTKGRARFAMNYGRQRGGLICVGGVCREVPPSNGVTANLVVTF
ncbi:DUF6029 family protein [Aequorivita lipolytica]|uniref:Uncharacterized protein n=1 Tax=Aequorivita lipolytica TaxID=153267 RepID=A0A5C6YPE1_9FLAO|nr:DUF6029 family protein [Aequorivita lipolytica]TXD68925.1 hypothetical protein ESV24_09210 [Aequorivita lipolytica]SRX53106.1 hypothetical protein AEQU2_02334 [Aequorivita lipolytica]